MNRPELDAQNTVISIPLRSIPMTMFHLKSFVNIDADFPRKSISLLTNNNNLYKNPDFGLKHKQTCL